MTISRSGFIQIVKSIFKAVVILVCALILLELCVRGILYITLTNYFNKKIPSPYGKVIMETGKFDFWGLTTINTYDPVCYFLPRGGFFRGPNGRTDYPLKKKENSVRIMCIGDSTTYGLFVGHDHSWPYLLETMLRAKYPGKKIEVLNAGIPGAVPRQIKRIFQFHLAKYRPDIVIWRGSTSLTDTYLVDTTPDLIKSLIGRFLYESRIFRVSCVMADSLKKSDDIAMADKIYEFMTDRAPKKLKPSMVGFDSDFSMVRKIAQDHGTKYALRAEYPSRMKDGGIRSETKNNNNEPVVKMLDVFEENDTKFSFWTHKNQVNIITKQLDALFIDSCHLTEKGEAITAEEVYKFIVKNKWIEAFN